MSGLKKMADAGADKAIKPETGEPERAAETPAPGSKDWVPGQPDKRSDHRTRGPTCPYRFGL